VTRDRGTLESEEVSYLRKVAVMSVAQHTSSTPVGGQGDLSALIATDGSTNHVNTVTGRVLALVRIAFGFTFLWAFFDKLLALGFSTGRAENGTVDRFGDAAWIHNGNPTEGFLKFGAKGPFEGFYHAIAGQTWVNVLFMLALLGIGTALLLGVAMRFAGLAGGVLYLMMWTVAMPPETNPLIDDHILGGLTIVALALLAAGDTWGLGHRWAKIPVVAKNPALR
jgi:thiosulfate dehydrogenase [quinone] large subunit